MLRVEAKEVPFLNGAVTYHSVWESTTGVLASC